jgi:hypothetical protein
MYLLHLEDIWFASYSHPVKMAVAASPPPAKECNAGWPMMRALAVVVPHRCA